ncbi:MAG TPA: ATP-binding cassette domain-containing protein [Steroidobacteraceae bacterium]|nr:ATP-binding cassette domain-containing protein [Steroidobacteraceae bacterium]
MNGAAALAAVALVKTYARPRGAPVVALQEVSIEVRHGELTALVGPDGAGKTTLMRLAAGLLRADGGMLRVLGVDVAADPQNVQDRIGYMPQRFGLYEDLTVAENLNLYADLHGVTAVERAARYPALMEMTALAEFQRRLAGHLSGGMKQKLGLACTLLRSPELLLLDEPTVGVDPLSRRELWNIVRRLVAEHGLTVLLSTAYMDEAQGCGRVIMLHQGRVLSQGAPQEVAAQAAGRSFIAVPNAGQSARALQALLLDQPDIVDAVPDGGRVRFVTAAPAGAAGARGETAIAAPADEALRGLRVAAAAPRFEDGFMILLQQGGARERVRSISMAHPLVAGAAQAIVQVRRLTKKFGAFTAVDRIDFEVRRGEIFGLLGPNGAGKTTTFRMLCGLLAPSGGELYVAGADVRGAAASARARLGYVAQKFSLYGPLSVGENLEFFASAYGLRGAAKRARIAWALEQFELGAHLHAMSARLPGGFKQRLAMAAALLHEPEILFLDEPTSGADPLARRGFWRRITALAEQGVTIIVTTHFMQEAEYCDRVAIMDAGRVLAQGSPAEVRQAATGASGAEPSMEDAFIAVVEGSRNGHAPAAAA